MRMRVITAVTSMVVAALITACTRADDPDQLHSVAVQMPAGALVESTPFTDIDPEVTTHADTAVRMRYRSTSANGQMPTEVTGAGFVPPGIPPYGGWPIIALAHGSTGVGTECGPTRDPSLLGLSGVVANFLALGYAVALTDYQGLGGPGGHPYLDAQTAGYNVIDSVRALRKVSTAVSSHYLAYGTSQGGAAAWAANEQAAAYAPELRLVGSASVVPPVDMSRYPAMAEERTLSPPQMSAYVWLLAGLDRTRQDFHLDDYRRGIAPATWDALLTCGTADATRRAEALKTITPEQLQPAGHEAEGKLTDLLDQMVLPQRRASAPMIVLYGGRDAYSPPEWIASAIERSCKMGSRVAARYQPDRGHDDIDGSSLPGWIAARFNGDPAPTTC